MLPLMVAAGLAGTVNLASAHVTSRRSEDAGVTPLLQYKIVGGAPVPANQYPYMAQVFNKVGDNESIQCGGTLISPTQVLTAAHCLYNPNTSKMTKRSQINSADGTVNYNAFVFIGGRVGAGEGNDKEREEFGVASIDCHNSFKFSSLENDICILTIDGVCIHPPASLNIWWNGLSKESLDAPGQKGTVLGWGISNVAKGTKSPFLRSANVPILDGSVCEKQYDGFNTKTTICAGAVAGIDTCEGDSGGPLLSVDGTQIGITSHGSACGKAGVPSAYTRVSAYSEWILSRLQ